MGAIGDICGCWGCVPVVEGGFVLGMAVLLLLLFGAVVAEVVFMWVLASS